MAKNMELQKLILSKFKNTDITVIINGVIRTDFIIHNANIVISNKTLFITDSNNKDLTISLDEATNILLHRYIVFEFDNLTVILDN